MEGNLLNLTSSAKLSMIPPVEASGNYFPHDIPRTPLPPLTGGDRHPTDNNRLHLLLVSHLGLSEQQLPAKHS